MNEKTKEEFNSGSTENKDSGQLDFLSRIKGFFDGREGKIRAILMVLAIAFLGYSVWNQFISNADEIKDEPYSKLSVDLNESKVKKIVLTRGFLGEQVAVELKEGAKYNVSTPHIDFEVAGKLSERGIEVEFNPPGTDYARYLSTLMMVMILVAIVMTMAPNLSGMGMGKPSKKDTKIRFSDVAGAEEAKRALQDAVSYLKEPGKFESLGARFPRGVIMYGDPGTGKTLLAKAVAGEAGANFISVSGSDFSSMFLGMTSMKIRRIFAQARKSAPCLIFIDEIDAIGGKRLSEGTAVAREMGSALNQMLVEMDGFDTTPGVMIIAATNRLELLDPALLRSGRFDRRIHMPAPNFSEREAILKIHAGKMKISEDFNFTSLARATIGMSGADLSNVMNQSGIMAAKEGALSVSTEHGLMARDVILIGEARTSVSNGFDEETRKLLAVHEAGHAVVGMLKGSDPVTRISIVPRGPALGLTFMSPLKERFVHDKKFMLSQIMVLLGGRAAEQFILNTSTTGARDDLMRATKIAQDMVCSHGMSSIGLLTVGEGASPQLQHAAEIQIKKILDESMDEAIMTIDSNIMFFRELVDLLLEREEIDECDINTLREKYGIVQGIPNESKTNEPVLEI